MLPPVILSLGDYREVRAMVGRAPASAARTLLERELARAIVALPHQLPDDIATLNSRVAYRYSAIDGRQVRTLVGPGGVDTSGGTLSVLAPIGAALLGLRAGSTLEWIEDGVPRSVTLERIMFPGGAGGTPAGGSART